MFRSHQTFCAELGRQVLTKVLGLSAQMGPWPSPKLNSVSPTLQCIRTAETTRGFAQGGDGSCPEPGCLMCPAHTSPAARQRLCTASRSLWASEPPRAGCFPPRPLPSRPLRESHSPLMNFQVHQSKKNSVSLGRIYGPGSALECEGWDPRASNVPKDEMLTLCY